MAVDPVDLDDVLTRARDARIPARDAGMTGGRRVIVDGVLDVALDDARAAWRGAIPSLFAPT